MAPQTLYYIRHGETDWNAEMRFQGRREVPLNETGKRQAQRNGEALCRVIGNTSKFRFVCSPMNRARETMEIIRGCLGLDIHDYEVDERLIEASYGELEGTTLDELKANQRPLHVSRKQDRWNFQPPGGESLEMTMHRIAPVIRELEGPTVIVAHGAVGRTVRRLLLGISETEAGQFRFVQDRIFRFEDGLETLV